MSFQKIISYVAVAAIAGILLGAIAVYAVLHSSLQEHGHGNSHEYVVDSVAVSVGEPVAVVAPWPVDSLRRESVHVSLPIARKEHRDTFSAKAEVTPCSAEVILPITTTIYADSSYRAVITGAFASLDTLEIIPRHEIVYRTRASPRHRWAIGPSVGMALTPRGMQPYIGVSVTYSIISF